MPNMEQIFSSIKAAGTVLGNRYKQSWGVLSGGGAARNKLLTRMATNAGIGAVAGASLNAARGRDWKTGAAFGAAGGAGFGMVGLGGFKRSIRAGKTVFNDLKGAAGTATTKTAAIATAGKVSNEVITAARNEANTELKATFRSRRIPTRSINQPAVYRGAYMSPESHRNWRITENIARTRSGNSSSGFLNSTVHAMQTGREVMPASFTNVPAYLRNPAKRHVVDKALRGNFSQTQLKRALQGRY